MDTKNLIEDLKALPEVKLKIFDLARETASPDGGFKPDMLANRYKEVADASDEAQAYAQYAEQAIKLLRRLLEAS